MLSQKGGSGKTTLSINLAIAGTLKGKSVVVIDLDPQQSAARWARLRSGDNPVIVSGHGPNVAELVEKGLFKREYRDHRLEWMIKSGGVEVVLKGLERDNIRFAPPFG